MPGRASWTWAWTDQGNAVVSRPRPRLLIDVLTAAWAALRLDGLGDQAFFQLVAARLIEPTSMLDSAGAG